MKLTVGAVEMGTQLDMTLKSGETVEIHTGAMLPESADAVVMIEQTQALDKGEVEILKPVAPGENLVQIGEDVRAQDTRHVTEGTDLKTPLRAGASDAERADLITGKWQQRTDRYSEIRSSVAGQSHKKVEMYYIGG